MISTIGAAIVNQKIEYGLVFIMLLGYLGLYLRAKESSRISVMKRYRWMVIAGGCYSILTRFFPEQLRADPVWGLLLGTKWIGGSTLDPRLVGSAYNPNFSAFLLLFAFSFVLSNLLRKKLMFKRMDWLLVFLLGYGIVATQSRAAIATMIILFLLFLYRYQRKLGLWVSGIVVCMLPFLLHILPRSDLIDLSTKVREQIWLNSIRIWEQHPVFGTTPLGFQAAYAAFGPPVPHAHNILLAFFSEYGTLGGLGFIVLLLWIGRKYLFLITSSKDHKRLLDTFILSLPIFLFTGILDHPLSSPQTALAVIPVLSFWDKYTEPLPILNFAIRWGSIHEFIPVNYQAFSIIRKRIKKKRILLDLKSQDYRLFENYLSLFLIIVGLLIIVRYFDIY
jgi:O-antigen ligase